MEERERTISTGRSDDYYDFDEKTQCLILRRHGNRFRLGDRLNVVIARADVKKKQLDMVLAGQEKKLQGKKPSTTPNKGGEKKKHRRGRK